MGGVRVFGSDGLRERAVCGDQGLAKVSTYGLACQRLVDRVSIDVEVPATMALERLQAEGSDEEVRAHVARKFSPADLSSVASYMWSPRVRLAIGDRLEKVRQRTPQTAGRRNGGDTRIGV